MLVQLTFVNLHRPSQRTPGLDHMISSRDTQIESHGGQIFLYVIFNGQCLDISQINELNERKNLSYNEHA